MLFNGCSEALRSTIRTQPTLLVRRTCRAPAQISEATRFLVCSVVVMCEMPPKPSILKSPNETQSSTRTMALQLTRWHSGPNAEANGLYISRRWKLTDTQPLPLRRER